jgi:hypothetical protein
MDAQSRLPKRRRDARKDIDWQADIKGILKAEMKRRDFSYADLASVLGDYGVHESEANLRNKVSRGGFSAVFFLQVMTALGVNVLHLNLFAYDQ